MRGQRAHRGLQILVRKSFGIRVREKPESGCVKKGTSCCVKNQRPKNDECITLFGRKKFTHNSHNIHTKIHTKIHTRIHTRIRTQTHTSIPPHRKPVVKNRESVVNNR